MKAILNPARKGREQTNGAGQAPFFCRPNDVINLKF